MKKIGLILAGGEGKRLYPLSTPEEPKQFMKIDGHTLYENTIGRIEGIVDDIYIVTTEKHYEKAKELTPKTYRENIIVEPLPKNTAASVLLGVLEIIKQNGDCGIGVFPSDHSIDDLEEFRKSVSYAFTIANNTRKVVTIGIEPDYASTDYGYIYADSRTVKHFTEKPDKKTAEKLVQSGYKWNSGIYVFGARHMVDLYERYSFSIYKRVSIIHNMRNEFKAMDQEMFTPFYESVPEGQFDKEITEKIYGEKGCLLTIPGNFKWNDLGNVKRFADSLEKTVAGRNVYIKDKEPEVVAKDVYDCFVKFEEPQEVKEVYLVGIQNIAIVQRDNKLYISRTDRLNEVSELENQK